MLDAHMRALLVRYATVYPKAQERDSAALNELAYLEESISRRIKPLETPGDEDEIEHARRLAG